ncbi:MAG TPA: LCP family protein [Actinomycetota bacterium]|nr:LCP family protein [Actinomycetota bacterium]
MYDGLKKLDVPAKNGRKPGKRRWLKLSLAGLLVLVVFVVSTGIFTYLKVTSNIKKGQRQIAGLIPAAPKDPLNILILGSDRRDVIEGTARNQRQFHGGSGQRADTIILLHIYGGAKHAVLISFPRDLRVDIPGHGMNKINAAYPLGGAELMIKTVSQLTGLSINHYVEVNFASFQSIVDAVGGVPMYFPKPLYDRKSGLNITTTGCINLNGAQALSFVRARYIYPTADLGRIQGQQRFIRALLNKVKGLGVLLNPIKLIDLSNVAGKGLIYDKGINLGLARSIANSLKFDNKKVDFRQYPGIPEYIGGVSYVVPEPTAARELFNSLKTGGPLPDVGKTGQSLPSPGDVIITLINASGKSGIAGTERTKLVTLGFHVPSISSSSKHITPTVITYQAGDELKAELVAKQFPGAILKPGTSSQSTDIIVTIGRSFGAPAASGSATPKTTSSPSAVGSCS